jgi:hypothetical protein
MKAMILVKLEAMDYSNQLNKLVLIYYYIREIWMHQ